MPAKKKASRKTRTSKKKTVPKKAAKKALQKMTARSKKVVKKAVARKTPSPGKKVSPARKKAVKKTPIKITPRKKTAPVRKMAVKKRTTRKKTATSNITILKAGKATRTSTRIKKISPYTQKQGEEYMSPDQVTHFREILLEWKRDLMEEVDRTVHHMQDDAANFPDPNDRATQEEEFALELRTRDRERKLIRKIDESLTNLDNGEYGYCEVCGVEIGIRRLEARPTATQCIDCKTLDEIKERQLG